MTSPPAVDDLSHLPLRERKKERTRRQLRDLALRMFSVEGYDAVSVERIAEAAEVAPRTFFRYYGTKEDVLLGDLRERVDQLPAALAEAGERHPADTVAAVLDGVLAVSEDYEAERERMLQQAAIVAQTPSTTGALLKVWVLWEAHVAAFVARREGCDPARDLYPALVAGTVAAAQRAALQQWVAGGGTDDAKALVRSALDQVVAGVQVHRVPHKGGVRG